MTEKPHLAVKTVKRRKVKPLVRHSQSHNFILGSISSADDDVSFCAIVAFLEIWSERISPTVD
jgi:hypothetical protein